MSGTTYTVDFGLDLDAGAERAGFPLTGGLVKVTNTETGEGDPQWFSMLELNDSISFRVWDTTTVAGLTAKFVCFMVTWVNPTRFNDLDSPLKNTNQNPCAFSGSNFSLVGSSPSKSQDKDAKSSVYPESTAGWVFGWPTNNPPPLGQIFTFTGSSSGTGSYYLRARLDVAISQEGVDKVTMRTFHWDPEIYVGGGGG